MESVSESELQQYILFGQGLLSMGMGGIIKAFSPQ